MDAYDAYEHACKRMRDIHDCISYYQSKIRELEDDLYDYGVQADEAYEAMKKEGQVETYILNEKTNIE